MLGLRHDQVFVLIEHLEHKVEHGLSLLEATSTERAIYDIFTTLDTDLSGRMETKGAQHARHTLFSLSFFSLLVECFFPSCT